MRKSLTLMIFLLLLFSMSACGKQETELNDTDSEMESASVTTDEMQSAKTEEENMQEEKASSLIVYFSRFGNTDYPGGIDASTSASIVINQDSFGTTEYVARMIQENIGGDLHLIQTQETYPVDFDEVRDQNHSEMDEGYLPPLVESNLDMARYDTVFIGYPVWATDVPQAVLSFLNEYDLSGKTVIPFCTHDGYGAGGSYDTIEEASHAEKLLDGLALESKDVLDAGDMVAKWIETISVSAQDDREAKGETAIKITIGDTILDGVLYDTALAQEIREEFPLTISMVGYGGREYYGGVDFYPENLEGGKKTFDNGDITYCEAHHNMAIFYAQTDAPTLSVDVIPIGRVTSNLSIFETLDSSEEVTFSLAESNTPMPASEY